MGMKIPLTSRFARAVEFPHAAPKRACGAWRDGLPVLQGIGVTLRELQPADASSLLVMLSGEEVTRFIMPPPTSVESFERFIDWTHAERKAGRYLCYGLVPDGYSSAIGVLQVRQLDPWFGTADWTCAVGSYFWGTGLVGEAANLLIDFTFQRIGVYRLEARVVVENRRASAALRKLGAVPEGMLRNSFVHSGRCFDQVLWAIVEHDRVRCKAVWGRTIH
jgi:ribosomal-protein-alanine N-acetyltransferase